MFCSKCGKKIPNDSKLCPYCGNPNNQPNTVQAEPNKPAKCWSVFNNVGYGLSIAGLATFWLPIIGWCLSIPGLVFSCLGKKDIVQRDKQQKSFGMSIAGIVLNFVVFLVLVIVIPVVVAKKS